MLIEKNGTSLVVFLLVDSTDGATPVVGIQPDVEISVNGSSFRTTTNSATEIGAGWYGVLLGANDTQTEGPVILRAFGDNTLEWRDILQVKETQTSATNGGTSGGGDNTGGGTGGGDNTGGGTGGGDNTGGGGNVTATSIVKNSDFSEGTRDWLFYSNGRAEWSVSNGVSTVSINRLGSNIQLYQKEIEVTTGNYNVTIEMRGPNGRKVQAFVHQHNLPRRNLGFAETFTLGNGWTTFSQTVRLQPNEKNARFRLWFAEHAKAGDVYNIRRIAVEPVQ